MGTAAATVLLGALTFVVGQICVRFFIDPVIEMRKLIGEIADTLIYYAPMWTSPGACSEPLNDEASRMLRQRSTQLRARAHAIPLYGVFSSIGVVPKREAVGSAAVALMGLSNSVHQGIAEDNQRREATIVNALGLRLWS